MRLLRDDGLVLAAMLMKPGPRLARRGVETSTVNGGVSRHPESFFGRKEVSFAGLLVLV